MSASARPDPRAAHLVLAALSAAALALLAIYFAHGHGRLDFADHARGRDFVNLWTAGRLIGEGRALEVFDPQAFMAAHHRLFSPRLPFHFWSYPPPGLLLAALWAWAPGYFAALAAWTALGLLALLPAARAALARAVGGDTGKRPLHPLIPAEAGTQCEPPARRSAVSSWSTLGRHVRGDERGKGDRSHQKSPELALLMLCPAVAVNVGLGQNGALTAALLLGGLALLDRRPLAAGALLGLLVFKPQVALLLPVMVLAGGRWRTAAAAATSATALLALSTALFGVESWRAFLHGAVPMQGQMLRFGSGPFMAMMPSAFMSARVLGAAWTTALGVQAPFTALGAWLVWRAWRTPDALPAERAAVLATATFVASPQGFNYDLIPTAFAALLLLRRSARPADAALAATAWALPVVMIGLGPARLPVAPLVLTALALRLAQLGGMLAQASRASQAGEAASHT